MNELIKVSYENDSPTVLGRELHERLEIKTDYSTWFKRMCEYGFNENIDYATCSSFLGSENQHGGQNKIDHQLTIEMAKEICMIQRSETGKKFRQYFIDIEKQWNTPEAVMARALQYANNQLAAITQQNKALETENAMQKQIIAEYSPKASYYDVVLQTADALSVTQIAKDYGKSAKWLNETLHEHGVQYKQGEIWLLYQKYAEAGYTRSKTHTYSGNDGKQHSKLHTYWTQKGRLFIYQLLKENGILPLMEQVTDEKGRRNK